MIKSMKKMYYIWISLNCENTINTYTSPDLPFFFLACGLCDGDGDEADFPVEADSAITGDCGER